MRALILVAIVAACAGPTAQMTMPLQRGAAIGTVTLGWSQAHVVFGEHPLLVDAGSPGEMAALERGVRALGVSLADVKCAVITHGHADHAANAQALRRRGITVIAGAGDHERMAKGLHGPHHPTGFTARILAWFLPAHYEGFIADVEVPVGGRYDLAPCGIAGEVLSMPGHTPGSLVVLVANGTIALVGDEFRGGLAYPEMPVEHFYQDDLAADHAAIKALLARGVVWFVLGHGGPISRAAVAAQF